ncbi:hypothetical protein RISK_000305 [Rhodopirellula islandica]|uniref:Uncharacterized protein n=1 Tax=Rhodopirellula islandica TaxID=595434 RepID=A0A0J1BMF1_RHOIS|nr:hypothetical protein RISK_000305 [Rhodopirellula islandica]
MSGVGGPWVETQGWRLPSLRDWGAFRCQTHAHWAVIAL